MPKRKNKAIKEYTLKNGEKRYMFKIFLGRNINRIKKKLPVGDLSLLLKQKKLIII